MPAVVVLGMHRSGTSLVASMLAAMGVDMGVDANLQHPSQPEGHWEDLRFVRVNNEILADHGGTWDDPPDIDWRPFRPDVAMLASLRQYPQLEGKPERPAEEWWGWKDPRTCLTAACWHRYLVNPHYIVVDRGVEGIVDSLAWREGQAGNHWRDLTARYLSERQRFLDAGPGAVLPLTYEELVDPATSRAACQRLASFLGMGEDAAESARAQVRRGPTGRIKVEPWLMTALRGAALAAEGRPAVVVLGEENMGLMRQVRQAVPDVRLVPVLPRWSGTWANLHGPIHGLLVTSAVDGGDALRWAARVRPGGFAAFRGVRVQHDWSKTAWTPQPAPAPWSLWQRRPFLKAGEPFGTVGVGVPFFKSDYNFFRWWSWILRHGLEPGDELLNDETVMAPLPIPVVHNRLMARFLESDRDTFLIIEDDHCGDPANLLDYEVVRRMREKVENHGFDIVTANYVNRRADPGVVGYGLSARPNRYGEYICRLDFNEVWKTGTQPVDGSVFGLALIRRWVLDKMLAFGNPKQAFWCEWRGANSQDVNFYGKARDMTGCQVGVDRDANIGHSASVVRGVADFWAAWGGQ